MTRNMSGSADKKHEVDDGQQTHLLDYLHVIQRRWQIALLVAVIVFVVVAAKTWLETPIYQASSTLRISLKPDTSQEVLEKRKERYFSIESELQVLQSSRVAERAAKLLQQNWRPAGMEGQPLAVRRLSLKHDLSDGLTLEILENSMFRLSSNGVVLLAEGRCDIPFDTDLVSGVVECKKMGSGAIFSLERLTSEQAAAMVSEGVQAYPIGDQVSMIGLTVERVDPRAARDVANAIGLAYQQLDREQKINEAGTVLELIEQQLAAIGRKLNVSEQNLQEFRIRTGLERLSPEGASLVDAAVALEKERSSLLLKKQRIEEFLEKPGFGRYESTVVDLLPGVPELMTRLFELQNIRSDLLREYTESYPAVNEVDDKISLLKGEIADAAALAEKNLNQQIETINQELAASSRRLENVPEEELELARLSRSSAVNAELYSYLLQRQQEERIMQASITGNVEIINEAILPSSPIRPNKKKNLGLGLLAGLLLGLGVSFFLEYLDRSIKDEDDVQDKLGLTTLGAIPRIDDAAVFENRQLVTHLEPHSIASEAFLALRTNIHFLLTNQKHKTLMLTSCLPDEGKSTVAVNLAATMAQTGAKTLLVGCDLRRPSLFQALGTDNTPGLSDLLVDNKATALRHIAPLKLDFIPGGTEPPNPTQLLSSKTMRRFLDSAKYKYDFVILDVPPLLPVADALILSSWVDLNVLVLEPCRVPEKMVKRAIQLLRNHEATIAGVVLNDKSGRGMKYYGGYNYYNDKYYQGYYRPEQSETQPSLWKRAGSWLWNRLND